MGYTPHGVDSAFSSTLHVMKNNSTKRTRTFGEFVTCVYDVCGSRKAGKVVQIAIKSQLIEFCGQHRIVIA